MKKKLTFKVEIRDKCKVCGKKIKVKGFRSYCSAECRNKFYNGKYAKMYADWQRRNQDLKATVPGEGKIKCLICGRYYVQVGTHIFLRHGITAREYREEFDLERKKGILPLWYKKLKGDQALENGTFKNLKKGKKYRCVPGDKRAGRYKRSKVTLERLKTLCKLKAKK